MDGCTCSCTNGYSGVNCGTCADSDGKFVDAKDGNKCKAKQCTCSTSDYTGTGASGTACPTDGDAKCVLCPTSGPYSYLSNDACEACPTGHECNGSGVATDPALPPTLHLGHIGVDSATGVFLTNSELPHHLIKICLMCFALILDPYLKTDKDEDKWELFGTHLRCHRKARAVQR